MSDTPSADVPFNAPPAQDPFQAAKASAMKAAEELRNAATQKAHELRQTAEGHAQNLKSAAEAKAHEVRERADELRQYADQALHDAKAKYADLRGEAESFAREKPMQALLTAFGAGLVLGLILRR